MEEEHSVVWLRMLSAERNGPFRRAFEARRLSKVEQQRLAEISGE